MRALKTAVPLTMLTCACGAHEPAFISWPEAQVGSWLLAVHRPNGSIEVFAHSNAEAPFTIDGDNVVSIEALAYERALGVPEGALASVGQLGTVARGLPKPDVVFESHAMGDGFSAFEVTASWSEAAQAFEYGSESPCIEFVAREVTTLSASGTRGAGAWLSDGAALITMGSELYRVDRDGATEITGCKTRVGYRSIKAVGDDVFLATTRAPPPFSLERVSVNLSALTCQLEVLGPLPSLHHVSLHEGVGAEPEGVVYALTSTGALYAIDEQWNWTLLFEGDFDRQRDPDDNAGLVWSGERETLIGYYDYPGVLTWSPAEGGHVQTFEPPGFEAMPAFKSVGYDPEIGYLAGSGWGELFSSDDGLHWTYVEDFGVDVKALLPIEGGFFMVMREGAARQIQAGHGVCSEGTAITGAPFLFALENQDRIVSVHRSDDIRHIFWIEPK